MSSTPQLLQPSLIRVVEASNLSWIQVKRVINSHRQRKFGVREAAYAVEETSPNVFKLRWEFVAK